MLESLITSKTRLRILVKFFINAANRAHMRGLADEFGESTNAIRKELNNLSKAGYLEKKSEGNRIDYRANTSHPLFKPLQEIVKKYLGLDTLVEKLVDRMGDVQQVWLLGDYARGIDSGKIEVFVVGEDLNEEYAYQLSDKIAELVGREVNISCGTANEMLPENRLLLFGQYTHLEDSFLK